MILDKVQYHIAELQKYAAPYGIKDIASDNNIKTFQIYETVQVLQSLKSRTGNDAVDSLGNEYELKTLDVSGKYIRTSHGLTHEIIDRYRKAHWLVGMLEDNCLIELYYVHPTAFEEFFVKCENKLLETGKKTLNDPPIPFKLVKERGTLIFTTEQSLVKKDDPSKTLMKLVSANKGRMLGSKDEAKSSTLEGLLE